jgi:dipeptidyl aminopeptidase/acylaminoacyl peptidase
MHRAALLAALLLQAPPAPATADERALSAEALWRLEEPDEVTFSPDGSLVAYTRRGQDLPGNRQIARVWVMSATGTDARPITGDGDFASSPRWMPDGTGLAVLSTRPLDDGEGAAAGRQIWIHLILDGDARAVTRAPAGVTEFAIAPDGARIAYVAMDGSGRSDRSGVVVGPPPPSRLWVVEVAGGRTTALTPASIDAASPAWSPDNRTLAFVGRPTASANDRLLSDLYLIDVPGGAPRRLTENEGPDTGPAWSPDGRFLAYVGHTRVQSSAVHNELSIVARTGGPPRSITGAFPYTVRQHRWLPGGRSLVFLTERGFESPLCRVDVETGRVSWLTSGPYVVDDIDLDERGGRIAFVRQDARSPGDVWIAPLEGPGARPLTRLNAWLSDHQLPSPEPIAWKSPDGRQVEGLLLRPQNGAGTPPLALEVHGGPNFRFRHGFYPLWQLLAASGIAVLGVNPRGSTGYSQEFLEANRRDWGGGDAADILSGVDAAVSRGLVDGERTAVMGVSYGGYMTAWLITKTTRFKAAVMGAGIANLVSYYGTTDVPRQIDSHFGDPSPEREALLRERSPITHASRVRTPTLILHGDRDLRVPVGQGQEMHQWLRASNVPVQFVRYPRAGHPAPGLRSLREPADGFDWTRRTLDWLDEHLTPRARTRGGRP